MVFAIPERLRLDNAANIYPASMSKDYSSLYRMSVTLKEPVDIVFSEELTESKSQGTLITISPSLFIWPRR